MHLRVGTEPCQLSLGIPSMIPFHALNRLLSIQAALNEIHHVPVSKGLHRLKRRRIPFGQEGSDFIDEALLKHHIDPLVDTPVELIPFNGEPDLQRMVWRFFKPVARMMV